MMQQVVEDLKLSNQLLVIEDEVDPELIMAAIHLKVYAKKGPAILFNKVKGSSYPALSNVFGTLERSKYIFRKQWDKVEDIIALRNNPTNALKSPLSHIGTAFSATNALPKKEKWDPTLFDKINISDLPQIKSWPMDGGAFVTLPQVYSEDPSQPGIMQSNLGMYRIQLSGNEYIPNKEIGLHYQIHRGIGVHHTKSKDKNEPLKVSIFIGGHPAHTISAVMPLPEGMSELTFAGMLAGRRFRYAYDEVGNAVSLDADFVITGEIDPTRTKPEGPFGDHLGYYSWAHPFPVMKVTNVYAKKNAIYPFTVVGRPPQEDTSFGDLIHEMTGSAIQAEMKGVQEIHAIDEAGVHPLLLAVGSERYTPYTDVQKPAEILTQAHHILGTGQLSLAKFVFITAPNDNHVVSAYKKEAFFEYFLSRVDWKRDVHFHTCTTIDTLDYSGGKLNEGSKVVLAAYGNTVRTLSNNPIKIDGYQSSVVQKGIIAISLPEFTDRKVAEADIEKLKQVLELSYPNIGDNYPLIVVCDDDAFVSKDFANFLWVTFTRANPSHDIYGMNESIQYKHWGCNGSLIIDARMKPYMPPAMEMSKEVSDKADEILLKYWKDYSI